MDADGLMAEVGLTPAQLADGDAKVPLRIPETLLRVYQSRYADRFPGLRLAEDVQPSTLGALGFLMQSCATLADLLEISVRFNGLLSSIGTTSVHHGPGEVEIRWACSAGSPALRRQLHEYVLGTSVVMGRLLLPGVPRMQRVVRFIHAAPTEFEHARIYRDFFDCPVLFGQSHNAIAVPSALLQTRLPHGDAALHALLETHTQRMFERHVTPTASLTDEVARLLHAQLLTGNPTREAVAQQLGMSPRSLHRRLEEEGTSYREQFDVVRLEIAQVRLADTAVAIADLAEQLGFSSPQAFMRWFRLRCDVTPGQYRRNVGEASAA